jgi:hypothetical protein
MRPRKLLASTAICGVLLAGCVETPTEGQKAAQGAAQPSVTVIQPTTVTKTCEGPCTTTRTGTPRGLRLRMLLGRLVQLPATVRATTVPDDRLRRHNDPHYAPSCGVRLRLLGCCNGPLPLASVLP